MDGLANSGRANCLLIENGEALAAIERPNSIRFIVVSRRENGEVESWSRMKREFLEWLDVHDVINVLPNKRGG
jgi:hypothetical protein